MKRKQAPKSVRRTVRLIVGGTTRKTVKRRLTMAQALREIGGDPVCTEGRLMTGIPFNRKRSLVRVVSVVLMYVADPKPLPIPCSIPVNMQGALAVIRAGVQL
jgi:hypothetical protein